MFGMNVQIQNWQDTFCGYHVSVKGKTFSVNFYWQFLDLLGMKNSMSKLKEQIEL